MKVGDKIFISHWVQNELPFLTPKEVEIIQIGQWIEEPCYTILLHSIPLTYRSSRTFATYIEALRDIIEMSKSAIEIAERTHRYATRELWRLEDASV
jgi:hypothetical protein